MGGGGGGGITKIFNIDLILASDVKYRFIFGIIAKNFLPETNFSQIDPEMKNSETLKDMQTLNKR